MTSLSDFPITKRWPPTRPDAIQLYSFPTANGVKVSIALEEMGLDYEAHRVLLNEAEVKSAEFRSLNPNGKIPAIIDPNGPGGAPLGIFESGAILIYLADKTGKLLPKSEPGRSEVLQWLMWQMGGLGPMVGQLGYFSKFAGSEIEDPRPKERFVTEARRLLLVFEGAIEGRNWIAGDFSIADIAIAPWLRSFETYGVRDAVGWVQFPNTQAYLERFLSRPTVQKALNIPPRDG